MLEKLLLKVMISCREATRLSSERFERSLSLGERWRLGFHNLFCVACRRWYPQLESLQQCLCEWKRRDGEAQIESGLCLDEQTRARMKEALRRERR